MVGSFVGDEVPSLRRAAVPVLKGGSNLLKQLQTSDDRGGRPHPERDFMPPDPPRLLRFGRFQISPAERMLRVDGVPAALGARAFDLLLALAERRERMVAKQELLDLVWPGVVVEEHNITAQISSLRKLLGPGVIATIPG